MNENVAPALYHFGGRVVELVNQRGDLLTGRRIDVETTPTRIREKVRILHRRHEAIAPPRPAQACPAAQYPYLGSYARVTDWEVRRIGIAVRARAVASEERLSALLISTNVGPNFMNMSIKKLNILILFRQGLHEDEMREFDYVRLHNNG
jgi:hypothetical protein